MSQILRCDWLPEGARWSHSCPLGTFSRTSQEKFPQKPYNKSFIDQVCSVMPDIGLVLFFYFFIFLRVLGPRLRLGP